jgi:hypothetical protein
MAYCIKVVMFVTSHERQMSPPAKDPAKQPTLDAFFGSGC